jgi:hypothetical protein
MHPPTTASAPEMMVFAGKKIFFSRNTSFRVVRTICSGFEAAVIVFDTVVPDTTAMVADTETMVAD